MIGNLPNLAPTRALPLGITVEENRPTLSLDFINVYFWILPPLPITELFIHGPIDSKEARKKLKTIIITTNSLATLHFEVRNTSAIYFTKKATAILNANRTITVFNLTLMGKMSALAFDADPWIPLNGCNGCTLTYTNVEPPSDLLPTT